MTYQEALKKRRIEAALVWPIVMLGKLLSPLFRPRGRHGIFLFCPSGDIGGSIIINLDILNQFTDKKPIVIFSKIPKDNKLLHLFDIPGVTVWDLHKKIDYKWYHFVNVFYRGVIAQWINKTPGTVVIGGESLYFHKVAPWVNKKVKTIELLHLDTWFNYSQQFVRDIHLRVFSTKHLMKSAAAFYDQQGIPAELKSRMLFIDTMKELPEEVPYPQNENLEVVFIGRGAPQKRVHLIADIAKRLHEKRLPVHISFVGDVSMVIDQESFPYCTFYGNVDDRGRMSEIQAASDVLLLTSAYEGLPVVIIEMMAIGRAVVSTAINAIPDYIKDGVNGFLLPDHDEESKIVEDGFIALSILSADRDTVRKMGKANRAMVQDLFNRDLFYKKWKEVIG